LNSYQQEKRAEGKLAIPSLTGVIGIPAAGSHDMSN